jgi:hypothetical protein
MGTQMLSFLTLCEKKQSHLKLHSLPRIGLTFVIFSAAVVAVVAVVAVAAAVVVAAVAAVAAVVAAAANKLPASFLKYGFNLPIYTV